MFEKFKDLIAENVISFLKDVSFPKAAITVIKHLDEFEKDELKNMVLNLMEERNLSEKTIKLYISELDRILDEHLITINTQNAKTVIAYLYLAMLKLNPNKIFNQSESLQPATKFETLQETLNTITGLAIAMGYVNNHIINTYYVELLKYEAMIQKMFDELDNIILFLNQKKEGD